MAILNKAQVDALFRREAVLIGTEDAVPFFRVKALFGKAAVEHARGFGAGESWNCTVCFFRSSSSRSEFSPIHCFNCATLLGLSSPVIFFARPDSSPWIWSETASAPLISS